MRFKYLNLLSFGCFTDYKLDFDTNRTFHLIYGPNEAGKSTFLRAITDVLYGIPERTGDAYTHSTSNLRIGAGLIHSNGREWSFVRRKGRANTLIDHEGTPIDGAILASFLGGINKETFQQMFGLNHIRLAEGGKRILQSGGSVGESLFEAASGISGLRQLFIELNEESKTLFKPGGKIPPINNDIFKYKEALRLVAEHSLAARGWSNLQLRFNNEEREVKELKTKIKQLVETKSRLERLSRTLPLLSKHKNYKTELVQLGSIALLPETARNERLELLKRIENAEKIKQTAEGEAKLLEEKKQNLNIVPELHELHNLISELYESLGLYRQSVKDVPRIQGEIEGNVQSVNTSMREVYPHISDLEEIEKLRPPLERLERARDLVTSHPVLMEKQRNIEDDIMAKMRAFDENMNKRKELGSVKDAGTLRLAIHKAQQKGNLEETLQDTRQNARQIQMQLAADIERLNLWSGTLEELEHLKVPMAATVESFIDQTDKVQNSIDKLNGDIEKLLEEIRGLEERLNQINLQEDVPTQADLKSTRLHRDMGWGFVKRAWLEGMSDPQIEREFCPDRPLPEAYEDAVLKTDSTADTMYLASKQVAIKATLFASRQSSGQKMAEQIERKTVLQSELKGLNDEWKVIWQSRAIEPLSPREMLSWLDHYDSIIEQARNLKCIEGTITDLELEIETHRNQIIKAFTYLGESVAENEQLADLILRGQDICSAIDRVSLSMEMLSEEADGLKQQLKEVAKKKLTIEKELAEWQGEWAQVMKEMSLRQDTKPGVARTLVDRIGWLFEEIDQLKKNRNAEKLKLNEIIEFESRVKNLLEKIPLDFSDLNTDLAVVKMKQKSDETSKDLARHDEIMNQIEGLEDKQNAAAIDMILADQELNVLMERAACCSLAELEKAEDTSERARVLHNKIYELDERLLENGDGLSLEQITSEAELFDPDTLPSKNEEIKLELEQLDNKRTILEQQFGGTKKDFEEKVNGNSTAATEAVEEAENILARLEREVARYVRIRMASALLRMGVERYREQNQSPVLKKASEFFSRLTLGSFSSLMVDYDAKDTPTLYGVRNSGEIVGVEGMSDGTQDQLFLSLRLASIDKYLQDIEPLPIVVDDILINFDDHRSKETIKVLASLSEQTQVIFLTHHRALIRLAEETLPETAISVYNL